MTNTTDIFETRHRSFGRLQVLVFLVCAAVLIANELPDWRNPATRATRLTTWLAGVEPDWLPFAPFILLFPLCWFGGGQGATVQGERSRKQWWNESPRCENRSLNLAWSLAVVVATTAFLISRQVGQQFDSMPPAYHDEYSYLIQAHTFLNGQWSSPSFKPAPELFDQLHVLNEGKFASRYFPGTGAWMAPFVGWEQPWLGHQLAQAIAAILVFWTGRELVNSGTGLLAGLLFACSPGLILFSNLLLAHHPTLVGLTFFLWSFCRFARTKHMPMALLAGCGLSFAMLCRPMTAAGFAFPFGVAFCWWWATGRWCVRSNGELEKFINFSHRSLIVFAMAFPLLVGFGIGLLQNVQVTGNPWSSPYQLYTDIYTPRHVYGFNNVIRGEQHLGPKVIDNYDRWAENLTPELAAKNVAARLISSWRLTLGIMPLLAATLIGLLTMKRGDVRWWLIVWSIVSLHVAHLPYWFVGIMEWHYVLETAPLWILLFAEVTRRVFVDWSLRSQSALKICWGIFIVVTVSVNLVTIRPLWASVLDRRMAEVQFPRQIYHQFRQGIEELRGGKPAIVFVIPDPADRSMDYVTNLPDWQQPILIARLNQRERLNEFASLFPERVVFLFDAKTRRWQSVPGVDQ